MSNYNHDNRFVAIITSVILLCLALCIISYKLMYYRNKAIVSYGDGFADGVIHVKDSILDDQVKEFLDTNTIAPIQ